MGEVATRLGRLVPVGIVYAVLIALAALGLGLAEESYAHAVWFIFFLAPFSIIYCIPFGLGVGILAQRLVWYTASYGHRVVAAGTALTLVALLMGWGERLVQNFDIIYLAAVVWPTIASAVSMLIGMYFVRAKEYEEAASYADEDDYVDEAYDEDDFEAYEGESYDDAASDDGGIEAVDAIGDTSELVVGEVA